MGIFILIVFAVANIFITNFFYRLVRKLGTSEYDKAKEELLMSKSDVAYKKTVTWVGVYIFSALIIGGTLLGTMASCSGDQTSQESSR